MGFSIDLGSWNSIFIVPSDVVDKYIKLASASQIKVLLWILRHSGSSFEINDIAEALSMHPEDIKDSIQYWVENGIITNKDNILKPPPATSEEKENNKPDNVNNKKLKLGNLTDKLNSKPIITRYPRPLSRPQKPDSVSLSKRINEAPEIAFLMQEAQLILGKTLSIGDSATLLMLHDSDGLPVDVIIMLLQYAVNIKKPHMRYIEKTAIEWSVEGIDSLQRAENKIRELTNSCTAYNIVKKIVSLDDHSPTAKESKFCNTWVNEWGFSDILIREAYERCVDNTGKFSFKYANKILENWHKNGITSIEQAIEEEKNMDKNSAKGKDTTYDIDAYEKSSIFDD